MVTPRRSESLMRKRDRLSNLPTAIILHIMSFLMIKDTVRTSILSKFWKDLWKSLPELKLHTSDFCKPLFFAECVSAIVSSRRGNYPLHTLDFNRHGYFQPQILTNLINYAISHGVQQLNMVVPYNFGLPFRVFSCHSLTSLYISGSLYDSQRKTRLPKYLDLPALTSLHLDDVAISADDSGHAEPFSTCNKLQNLCLERCRLLYGSSTSIVVDGVLNIINGTLSKLTIHETIGIRYFILAPKLKSFTVNGSLLQTSNLPEWVKIDSK